MRCKDCGTALLTEEERAIEFCDRCAKRCPRCHKLTKGWTASEREKRRGICVECYVAVKDSPRHRLMRTLANNYCDARDAREIRRKGNVSP